jgi:pterin-4a-carbinolamine dehydratase
VLTPWIYDRYHCAASAMNLVWGCGIDGIEDRARDIFHACVHGFMGFGFSWMVFKHRRKPAQHLGLNAPWILRYDALELRIIAKNWQAVMDALKEISDISEKMNHHPDISIEEYRKLKIVIRTHCRSDEDAPGFVTQKDVQLARAIESVPIQVSEKWMRENNIKWKGRTKAS